jgi:hypothetical protein
MCRFNLDEGELRSIVEPWTRESWVELGERKWSPHQAKLTILEGPHIPLEQLKMGRGWRAAQRGSKDVTERLLAAVKGAANEMGSVSSQDSPEPSPPDPALVADSLGLELLAALGDGPAPLSQAWRLAAMRFPESAPAECLTLAEQAVRSLLRGHLIVLLRAPSPGTPVPGDQQQGGAEVGEAEVDVVLRQLDSWAEVRASGGVRVRRA